MSTSPAHSGTGRLRGCRAGWGRSPVGARAEGQSDRCHSGVTTKTSSQRQHQGRKVLGLPVSCAEAGPADVWVGEEVQPASGYWERPE